MSVSDDAFAQVVAITRLQADAMQHGDEHGRHARALRRLIERVEGVADDMERGGWHSKRLDKLRAAIQEAREAVDA